MLDHSLPFLTISDQGIAFVLPSDLVPHVEAPGTCSVALKARLVIAVAKAAHIVRSVTLS